MNEETQKAIIQLELRTLDRFERYLKIMQTQNNSTMWLLIFFAATILTTVYCVANISDLRDRISKIEKIVESQKD